MQSLSNLKKWFVGSVTVSVALAILSGCSANGTSSKAQASTSETSTTPFKSSTLSSQMHATPYKPATKTKLHSVVTIPVKASRVPRAGDFYVPILEYHDSRYVPNWAYGAAPGQFAAEMKFLYTHHFHTITLDRVWAAMKYGQKLPTRPVVITFDDGHESNYTMATPILKKYKFVATEFDVTSSIGKPGFLSVKELRDMQKSGVWEIESHTVHHPHLSKLTPTGIAYEVTASKLTLQAILGRQVNYFCYPYGDYDPAVVRAVQKAGYRLATTVHQGYANPYMQGPLTLRRVAAHEGLSLSDFARKLSPSMLQMDSGLKPPMTASKHQPHPDGKYTKKSVSAWHFGEHQVIQYVART